MKRSSGFQVFITILTVIYALYRFYWVIFNTGAGDQPIWRTFLFVCIFFVAAYLIVGTLLSWRTNVFALLLTALLMAVFAIIELCVILAHPADIPVTSLLLKSILLVFEILAWPMLCTAMVTDAFSDNRIVRILKYVFGVLTFGLAVAFVGTVLVYLGIDLFNAEWGRNSVEYVFNALFYVLMLSFLASIFVDDNYRFNIAMHIVLLLATFGLWFFVWVYRATAFTNEVEGEQKRDPLPCVIFCALMPYYLIYWSYETARRLDKMAARRGVRSPSAVVSLILSVFFSILVSIWLQFNINRCADAIQANAPLVEPKPAPAEKDIETYRINLAAHILLLIFTCGIWNLIWVYRTTRLTNASKDAPARDPLAQALLCFLIPMYRLIWSYETAVRTEKLAAERGLSAPLVYPCLIFAALIPIGSPILMQIEINRMVAKPVVSGTEPSTDSATTVLDRSCYMRAGLHLLLCILTLGIWQFFWVYRMTRFTNGLAGEAKRDPVAELLLCIFLPGYMVFWFYKTAKFVDKIAAVYSVSSGLMSICSFFAIVFNLVPLVLIQARVNECIRVSDRHASRAQRLV